MVQGICLAQRGDKPLYKPYVPSSYKILLKAGYNLVGKVPGFDVYILTLVASQGQSKISAMNSAQAEEIE